MDKLLSQTSVCIENPGCLKLAVCLSVANLPYNVQSNTDHMSLVLLCGDKDLKQFGCAKLFSEMLEDLKDLEENGISLDYKTIKAAPHCIAGDNLGSQHWGIYRELQWLKVFL